MQNTGIFPTYIEILKSRGITEATAVQKEVIPTIRSSKNVLFRSETGTGKTLAYLLPLFETIDLQKKATQILIAAPTHELASQIKNEIQATSDFSAALVIGGSPIKRQSEALKKKPHFVVGGPARILELIHLKKLKTEHITTIVFDEVDRLLSPELRDITTDLLHRILNQTNKTINRRLIACSATIKDSIKRILENELNSIEGGDLICTLMPEEDILKSHIQHLAFHAERRDKINTLRSLLAAAGISGDQKKSTYKALVFTGRVGDVDDIVQRLQFKKVLCAGLHAKTDKIKRKQAIDRFRSGKCPVLITSDLAARGLDIQGITHVIQMDVPSNEDFFIHRSGRTARAGNRGVNAIIADEYELRNLSKIEKKLGIIIYPRQLRNGKIEEPEL